MNYWWDVHQKHIWDSWYIPASAEYMSYKVARRIKRDQPLKIYCVLDFPADHKSTKDYSRAFKKYSTKIFIDFVRRSAGRFSSVEKISDFEYLVDFEEKDKESTIDLLHFYFKRKSLFIFFLENGHR